VFLQPVSKANVIVVPAVFVSYCTQSNSTCRLCCWMMHALQPATSYIDGLCVREFVSRGWHSVTIT